MRQLLKTCVLWALIITPSLGYANDNSTYSITYINPAYQIEATDPNHHWAPKLNEAYANEYTKEYVGPGFFNWVEQVKTLPQTHYIDLNNLADFKQKFIHPNIAINESTGNKHPKGMELYVMDYNGDFYTHPKIKPKTGVTGFNHSSLLHAGPLSSAGFLHFNEHGEIFAVDNYSGHYHPDDTQIINALDSLKNKGIELEKIDLYKRISSDSFDKNIYNAQTWYDQHKQLLSNAKLTDMIIYDLYHSISKHNLNGAFVVGGGIAYDSKNYITGKANDIDSMLVFANRQDMDEFIKSTSKEKLTELFNYDNLTYFNKDEIDFFLDNNIEVMRISGKIKGLKVTIKLINAKALEEAGPDTLFQVMSKGKDKRVFYGRSLKGDPVTIMIINQSFKDKDDVDSYVILDKNYYSFNDSYVPGLITDFIITAKAIKDYNGIFNKLQHEMHSQFVRLLQKKGCVRENEKLTAFFVREDRFSEQYKNNLIKQLGAHSNGIITQTPSCLTPPNHGYIVEINPKLFSKPIVNFKYTKPEKISTPQFPSDMKSLLQHAANEMNPPILQKIYISPLSEEERVFTSNINSGKIFHGKINTEEHREYFYKFMRADDPMSIANEALNMPNIVQLFDNTVEPVYVDPKYRFFLAPWINGKTLAEYITVDLNKNKDTVFKVELTRAEQTIKSYIASMKTVQEIDSSTQPIHRLYYDRITGKRMEDFYSGKNVQLPGNQSINFDTLKHYSFLINGHEYPPLSEIINNATIYLDPTFLNDKIKIYGLADNHSGNIIIDTQGQYYTIDYEYAGISHPAQNLTKTIFNDSFTKLLHGNINSKNLEKFIVDTKNKQIIIDHNYVLSNEEIALLKMKIEGVLDAVRYIARAQNLNVDDWDNILKASLFVAGFLTKDLLAYSPEQTAISFALLVKIATDGPL
ncbi:MAG: hypothetical protein HON32_09610 [Francisellaceae bacterium]|nr:hypothetical protein [Francisellaceae bacterium]